MKNIYGVNLNKEFGPKDVRDAIVDCFHNFHRREVVKSFGACNVEDKNLESGIKDNTKEFVRKAFDATGGDFENPDKNSIMKAMDRLKDFSFKFRKKGLVEENYNTIMQLVNKL